MTRHPSSTRTPGRTAAALGAALTVLLAGAARGQTIRTVATFNNVGVEVTFAAPPSPTATVALAVQGPGEAGYRPAHPLCRIASNAFAGSAFGLLSGTAYTLRVSSPAHQYVTVTTRPDVFPPATNRTFHVAITGNDSHSGLSATNAFRTLGKALSLVLPGDRVLMHGGRYYEGDYEMPEDRSGTPANPIVIENAPDEQPVLDGTDTNFVPAWTLVDAAHGVYRSPCTTQPENVYRDGGHLFRFADLDDLRTGRWEQTSGCYVDSTHLYVRLPAGSPPGAHQVTIPRFTTGLTLECSHYQVRGLEFCYYGHGPYHRGIYLHFGCSNLVERCAFHHNGIGVAIKRSASFNTIQHCRFSETPLPEWSWGAVKENGVDYEAGGVYVYGSEIANEGNVIRYNVFEDLFDGCHLYSNDDDPPGPTKNLDFHDNVITRCGDDGLETDGLGSNVRIYGNRWTTCLSGISLAPARIGPVYVFRNVILGWHSVDSHSDGLYEGYPFKFNHSDGGTTPWVFVYHNTCVSDVPGQDAFLFKEYCDWTNVVSRNNIYAGTDHALDCWETPNPVDFDYDDLFTTSGSAFIRWGATDYATLPAFAAGTGREIHGLAVNPGFSDTVAGDFRLRTGSPLIDRGVLIPGVNEDYVGRAPDIGAFEFRHSACGLSRSNSTLFSTWTAISGMVYRLQHREDMRAGTWTNLSPAVTARSWTVVFSNAPPAGRGFYRLLQY